MVSDYRNCSKYVKCRFYEVGDDEINLSKTEYDKYELDNLVFGLLRLHLYKVIGDFLVIKAV